MNKISSLLNNKKVSYGDKPMFNSWLLGEKKQSNVGGILMQFLSPQLGEILCIQTPKLTDPATISLILKCSEHIRTYLLVNEYTKELNALQEKVLIRYGVNVKGSTILRNPNSNNPDGIFLTGELSEQNIHSSFLKNNLEKEVISKLYRHFCYLFWEEAKYEVIEKDRHSSINSKPMDIFHNPNEYGDKDYVFASLFEAFKETNRENLIGKTIVPIGKEYEKPIEILAFSKKDLNSLTFDELPPKEKFENSNPIFEDDNFSAEIEYKWEIMPFYLPENIVEHPLYKKWEQEKKNIISLVDELIKKIETLKDKESFKADRAFLANLKNISFGKDKSLSENIQRVNEIYKNISSSANKQIVTEISQKINNLKREVETNIKSLTEKRETLRNLTEPKEKERLNQKITQLDKDINNLKSKIEEKEREIEKINSSNKEEKLFIEEIKLPLLPSVGKLYNAKDVNYLAISFWEEYDAANIEAQRFNAKLCANK